jgi:hypothetical protein
MTRQELVGWLVYLEIVAARGDRWIDVGQGSQRLRLEWASAEGEGLVVVHGRVCARGAMSFQQAIAFNDALAADGLGAGSLTIVGDAYVLRRVISPADLRKDELIRVLDAMCRAAASVRRAARRPSSTPRPSPAPR